MQTFPKLTAAGRKSKNVGLACAVVLAIETGMRRGEIAQLTWEHVDFHTHTITLELTKNGDKRIVPLSERAELALRQLPRNIDGRVFTFHDSNGLDASFACACERAGIKNLRFHDLRHEAASRYASTDACHRSRKAHGLEVVADDSALLQPAPTRACCSCAFSLNLHPATGCVPQN